MTSVVKKIWVAITGLLLSGFVLSHMLGNMLIIVGAQTYNEYSHKLITNPFIYPVEAILVLIFLVHIVLAILLTRENKIARPIPPSMSASQCAKAARFGSQYMALTGILTLAFAIFHLYSFKYGTHYSVTYNGVEMRDLHRLVVEEFHNPLYTGLYLVCMIILGVHLSHGASALVQTLGISSVRCRCLKRAGWAFAILVAGGFFIQPIYCYFYQGGH